MNQEQAQALAVATWGKDAIASIDMYNRDGDLDPVCFVSRTKYGLSSPYGHGKTFEQAFYNSQFGYTTDTAYNGGVPCHYDGSKDNRSKWANEWAHIQETSCR